MRSRQKHDLELSLADAERCRLLLWEQVRVERARSSSAWFALRRRAGRLAALEHEAMLFDVVVESLRHARGPSSVVVSADVLPNVYALHHADREPAVVRGDTGDTAIPGLGRLQAWVTVAAVAVVVLRWMHHDTAMRTWLFLDDVEHVAALGLHAGDERAGAWRLEHHQNATGRRALVNHQGDADAPPATAVWRGNLSGDVLVRTRCSVARTGREQACGVVFGWQSERDHWVARVDVSGGVVAVVRVENGVERLLATAPIPTTDVPWHGIVVTAQGDRIVVDHDGGAQIEVVDVAARRRGGVGLWAPATSTAYFDELTVQSLDRSHDLIDALS